MADGMIFVDKDITDKQRRETPQKILYIIIVLLSAAIFFELLFHFVVAPRLIIDTVQIESSLPLSKQKILDTAGIDGDDYFFSFNSDIVQEKLEAIPMVKNVIVGKIFPNKVRLVLYGRKPVAISLIEKEGKTVPLLLDEEGVIYKYGSSIKEWDLPVISGIKFEDVYLGMKLPDMIVSFLQYLKELKYSAPSIFNLFSEYRIINRGNGAFEVLVYPIHYSVPVRIDTSLDEEVCKTIFMVLDALQKKDLIAKIEEIDFRSGEVVYRLKEE